MKVIGNIIWFIFVGLWYAILYSLLGIIWCITIIGIPFGKQAFKIAGLMLFPFGKDVNTNFDSHPFANIVWLVFGGIEMAFGYLVIGLILCITIIGIPFGKQCFKLASLCAVPFGASY